MAVPSWARIIRTFAPCEIRFSTSRPASPPTTSASFETYGRLGGAKAALIGRLVPLRPAFLLIHVPRDAEPAPGFGRDGGPQPATGEAAGLAAPGKPRQRAGKAAADGDAAGCGGGGGRSSGSGKCGDAAAEVRKPVSAAEAVGAAVRRSAQQAGALQAEAEGRGSRKRGDSASSHRSMVPPSGDMPETLVGRYSPWRGAVTKYGGIRWSATGSGDGALVTSPRRRRPGPPLREHVARRRPIIPSGPGHGAGTRRCSTRCGGRARRREVHARNLFHVSAAMWDAWAVYKPTSGGYFVTEKRSRPDGPPRATKFISYAAYPRADVALHQVRGRRRVAVGVRQPDGRAVLSARTGRRPTAIRGSASATASRRR